MSNITTAQHTPTPWRVGKPNRMGSVVANVPVPEIGGSEDVAYYGGHLIAESIAPRNAAFIVRACNSNAALVNALQLLADKVEACGGYPAFRDELQHARAALHLAAAGA